MSEKRDYYEVLGLAQEASGDDIRRAYRKAALQHHPDRNPDNPEAEALFKEATEAYSVLSDDDKRARYDRFGHAGVSGQPGVDFSGTGMSDIFSQFQDIFGDFFGGFSGRGRRGPPRGQDVGVRVQLELREAMEGVKREVEVQGQVHCDTCQGTGAEPGTSPERCGHCHGTGQVGTQRGFIMFSTTCPACRGEGSRIAHPCGDCSGSGVVDKERRVVVTVPAGIDAGQRLRVPGQGMPAPAGGVPGDLYVEVELEEHPLFKRDGFDLVAKDEVSFAMAALGGTINLELPDGNAVEAAVKPGTQPGTVVTIRGRGLPRLDRSGRGNVHIIVSVYVPKRLSKRAKKLLQELDEELSSSDKRAVG